MSVKMRAVFVAGALVFPAYQAKAQSATVEYEVDLSRAAQHEARITATFRGVRRGKPLEARMARSSPGRYSPTGFAKNVYDVSADDGRGRALAVTRPHPHGWDVHGHNGTVRISYTVFGNRTDGTYLSLDSSHAHMNMPATFMFAPKMSAAPVRLKIGATPGWHVTTQLARTPDSTVFTAPNMQYFMDSPTEAGPVMMSAWEATFGGRRSTIMLAVHHDGTQAQVDSLAALTRKVVAEQFAVWGEQPAFDYGTYTFIADYRTGVSGDGMEHRNSTIVTGSRNIAGHAAQMNQLSTISHEFLHAWNIERLRPKSLEPFDFERDNMSDELWLGEGFGNYYGPLTIRRAGLYTDDEFLKDMGGEVLFVIRAEGRKHGTPVTMSRLAPFFDGAAWRDPTNIANTFISYYTWGSTVALALDLTLRSRYGKTLDDYMRALWRVYGRHQSKALAPGKPYTMSDARAELVKLTDAAFANDFFNRYIEGSEVPDYITLFASAGILIVPDGANARVVTYESEGKAVTDAMRKFREDWLGSKAVEVRGARYEVRGSSF